MTNAQTQETPAADDTPDANTATGTVLDRVNTPADIKPLNDEDIITLANDVRTATITAVSKTGGHLGAGLGVVELTTAIHAVFDTPHDKLIWDVGHQCYPHKILTGRKDRIDTLRKGGGLSGFTKRAESEYDPFGAGHSSTSISAALGMSVASDLENTGKNVIAVIGDGAMSAGMAYEAMNNAGSMKSRLIVILNDNEMSIAPPVGAMSKYLTKLVSSKTYIGAREVGKKITDVLPSPIRHAAKRIEEGARISIGGGSLFEEMGFYYVGPVDGHNMEHLLAVLRNVRDSEHEGPFLIHALTEKGKGYTHAETAKDKMHGVKTFDVVTGKQAKGKENTPPSYTKVFGTTLVQLADTDDKIVGITAAMPDGTGMDIFAASHPDKMFDVGIAEQHGVTFAAGLAAEGFKPFTAIYSTFLQRGYDQVVHDVALQNLPVRFAIDRAGLVGADGQTHAGAFDTAFLGCLPNMTLMAAGDEADLAHMVATAAAYDDGPIAFRFPRGEGTGADLPAQPQILKIGKGRIVHLSPSLRAKGEAIQNPLSGLPRSARNDKQGDIAILSYGGRLSECLLAAEALEKKGISATIADARFAKPLDEKLIKDLVKNHKALLTIEEGSIGGFGSYVLEYLSRTGLTDNGIKIRTMHLPDTYQNQNTPEQQYKEAGLTASHIAKLAKTLL